MTAAASHAPAWRRTVTRAQRSRPASIPSVRRPVLSAASGEKRGVRQAERGGLAGVQRARLLSAAGQSACERGACNVTVAHIVERAGVSRRTFYEVFSDTEDCLWAALGDALERVQERILPAWRAPGPWRERLRASLTELLWLFDEEPTVARLLLVESLAMGRRSVLEKRAQVLERVIDAVHEGSACARNGLAPTRFSAEGAVGGVLSTLHARTVEGANGGLTDLAGPLMNMLVLPYLGPAAARRELARQVAVKPAASAGGEPAPLALDPFKEAGMRLTYRTISALSAVAARPGCSNRQVGEMAQIGDQGQISKLLARLERLGMIENREEGQRSRGEANAWTLTSLGEQVASSLGVRVMSGRPPKHRAKREDPA